MRPYDSQRDYLRWYFKGYPHVMVVKKDQVVGDAWPVLWEWMQANLAESYTSHKEDCMGGHYTVDIIGFGFMSVTDRPDEEFFLVHDNANFDKLVEHLGDAVITTDPFGPDLCPGCGGPMLEPKRRGLFSRIFA